MKRSPAGVWETKCACAEAVMVDGVISACEEARTRAGLTLTDVARHAHLSPRMLRYIRAGRSRPSLRRLAGLAEAHGLELVIRVRSKRSVKDLASMHTEEGVQDGGIE